MILSTVSSALTDDQHQRRNHLVAMDGNGETSDTDSGIILHSGSDSPTSHTKDVATHTRAMKLKHQSLQDRLEICILELKKLCIREAELTGQLSEDYPLLPGEKPPQIRRRIGAAFKLDTLSIPRGGEESELSLIDAELALQTKIYEAARKLCQEEHLSKAIRRSRLQQCKREEKKLKQLQESAFHLRLEHGRTSPLPAFNIAQQDLGTSDDSSLSDSAVQDEEVASQSSQPSSGLLFPAEAEQNLTVSSELSRDLSYQSPISVAQNLRLTPTQSPHHNLDSPLSFSSSPVYDAPPIEHSPWTESSLDQPFQKSRKSRSSSKTSQSTTETLPSLEDCLANAALPQQLSHLRLCRTQSNSTPSTPEMRVHRQLSLRLSGPDSSFGQERERGRSRSARRRLTITVPETTPQNMKYRSHASSEESGSEHSFASYNSSPCQELPHNLPKQYLSPLPHCSPISNYRPQVFPGSGYYNSPRKQPSMGTHGAYYNDEAIYGTEADVHRSYYAACPFNRYDYRFNEAPASLQRLLPDVRLSPSTALEHPRCHSSVLPRQIVNEHLKSWHRRSQFKSPRSRSLDRQGAVRIKNMAFRDYQDQVIQRRAQMAADDCQRHWIGDDGTHYVSQV
ncbi:innate immunity activator protein-like isoform 1-T2 [Synchiropus picturatus]